MPFITIVCFLMVRVYEPASDASGSNPITVSLLEIFFN